jgi:hypothetical protein
VSAVCDSLKACDERDLPIIYSLKNKNPKTPNYQSLSLAHTLT